MNSFKALYRGVALSAIAGSALLATATGAGAQDDGGGDVRSAVQNPISALISLPFKFTFDNGAPNGDANFLNIQPVYPVTVGDWNLVNRLIVPIADAPGGVTTPGVPNPTGGGRETGLGDINYSLFLNPVESSAPFTTRCSARRNGAPARPRWRWPSPAGAPMAP
jgi:hypothetical protein